MIINIIFVLFLALIFGKCSNYELHPYPFDNFLFPQVASRRSHRSEFSASSTINDPHGGGGKELFAQLTPCVPPELCERAYDSNRGKDLRNFGEIPACPEENLVRCLNQKEDVATMTPFLSQGEEGPTHFVIPIFEDVAPSNDDDFYTTTTELSSPTLPPIIDEPSTEIESQTVTPLPKVFMTPPPPKKEVVTPTTSALPTPPPSYGVPGLVPGKPLGYTSRFGYPYYRSMQHFYPPLFGFKKRFSLSKGFGFFG